MRTQKQPSNFDERPGDGFIREAQLIPNLIPFSSATLWRKVKSGDFPAPIKLSARVTAWKVAEVRQWLDSVRGAA